MTPGKKGFRHLLCWDTCPLQYRVKLNTSSGRSAQLLQVHILYLCSTNLAYALGTNLRESSVTTLETSRSQEPLLTISSPSLDMSM